MKNQNIFLFILILCLSGCMHSNRRKLDVNVDNISIEPVQISRYEKALFSIPPDQLQSGLKEIAADFPVFLNVDLDDTLNVIQLHQFVSEPLNRKLYDSTMAAYPNLDFLVEGFSDGFKRFKYYFPDGIVPDVFTFVSGLHYEKPIQFFNDDMIIALDMYLGADYIDYRRMRLSLYQILKMNREYIVRDGMYELYYYNFLESAGKDFLQHMINKGKHLYYMDAIMPHLPDHIKIGYPKNKLNWCTENETNIWAFIISNDLLYSSDALVNRKFFADGPFTADFSNDSPARIGEWIGWQVVRAYMDNNKQITLEDLMAEEDAQKILKLSAFKPRNK